MDHLDDDSGDNGENDWVVSYADMMTLIACFFILMMAFANYDPIGFNIKAEKLSQSFRKDKYKSSTMKFTEITEEIARHELKDRTKISMKDSELVVKFSSSVMFENGQARLNDDVLEVLDSLIDIIKVSNASYRILVEGHSDDSLEGTQYRTQWDLSSARAAAVAQRFENFGFSSDKIVPIGRGNSSLLVDSRGPEGERVEEKAQLNRRVVIRLLEPYEKQAVKFGLGVYFKDATEDVKEDSLDAIDAREFEIEGGNN